MPPKRTHLESPNPVKHQMVDLERVSNANSTLLISQIAPNAELLEKLSVSPDARDTVEVVGDFSTAAEFSDLGRAKRKPDIRQLGRHFNAVVSMVSDLTVLKGSWSLNQIRWCCKI